MSDADWQPVSILLGDRLCDGCGYNLHGQTIFREPHYDLHVTRCPSCEQIAALQSYPALSRWTERWALFAAAAWMFLLVVIGVGGLGFVSITTIASVAESTDAFPRALQEDYRVWLGEQHPDVPTWDMTYYRDYWEVEGAAGLFRHAPYRRYIETDEIALVMLPTIAAFVLGCFWSVALLQRRRRTVLIGGVLVALALLSLAGIAWACLVLLPPLSSEQIAWRHLQMPLIMSVLVLVGTIFTVGLLVGRSVVRGIVRALMPPRMRGALSVLWTAAGDPVPRGPRPESRS